MIPIDTAVIEAFVTCQAATRPGGLHPWLLSRGVQQMLQAATARKPATATAAAMEALGGADRLILDCLDGELEKLNLSHKELLFLWCGVLISPDGYRHSVTEKALIDYAGKLNRFITTRVPILLGDGMGDHPVEELGGRTPLQACAGWTRT